MGYKALELTLISARGLKNVSLLGKMDVYVVVSLSGDPRSKQKSPVHQDGGSNPYWNYTVRFTVDESAAAYSGWAVVIQLKHKHTFGGDKDVGEVRVPVKDLIEGFRDKKEAEILTYQVRRPSGKPKGELTFSYKVMDAIHHPKAAPPPPAPVTAYPPQGSSSSVVYPPPQTAYPHQTAYPPQTAYPAYPPQVAYPAPPPMGYAYQQQGGYGHGYPVQGQIPQRPRKNGGLGMGLGAGLLGGALGGLLIGDMVSDANDDGYYDGGDGDMGMDFGGDGDMGMDF